MDLLSKFFPFLAKAFQSTLVTRVITILAFAPFVFKGAYWVFKKFCWILWFLFGWILPARVYGNVIRLRRIGPAYWIILPAVATLLHHFNITRTIWSYASVILSENLIGRIENFLSAEWIPPLLSKIVRTEVPGVEQLWFYFMALVAFSTLVYLIIRLIDVEKIQDISLVLLISLMIGIGIYAIAQGALDAQIAMGYDLWASEPAVLIAWGLLSIWVVINMYAVFEETYDFDIANKTLVKVQNPEPKLMHNKNTIIKRKYNNIFRFCFLGGAYDLVGEPIERDKPYDPVFIRYTFGLSFAVLAWRIRHRDKAISLGTSESSATILVEEQIPTGRRRARVKNFFKKLLTKKEAPDSPKVGPEAELSPDPSNESKTAKETESPSGESASRTSTATA